ncbi:MAG: PDDEXK nuclease domain-containing protein [Flavobacteriaceae bacterium]|nr:PDDEXK nuclease domain-containing protein [Flavobacteriaceae bacterium]
MSEKSRKQRGKEKDKVVFPLAESLTNLPSAYPNFIAELKSKIAKERLKTVISANVSMLLLYWEIGNSILKQQKNEGWGTKVIDRMSYDLKQEFPAMKGFSARNLKYMRKFAETWQDYQIVQRTVAQIPWRSNIVLMDKINDNNLRLWYANKTIELGLSKDVLVFQIESQLHLREGNATTNFKEALPPIQSDMAQQIIKDPYIFDFVGNDAHLRELELENNLLQHIQKFLLELGQGFAFVGKQVHLELGEKDFYVDLLFYHLKLRCYVVVELKTGEFKPGYISKLNMYINVVNDVLKHKDDKETIGLLLVKNKNKLVVEYSLAGFKNPIGVSNWENEIVKSLPKEFKSNLPTIEEIESQLNKKEKYNG